MMHPGRQAATTAETLFSKQKRETLVFFISVILMKSGKSFSKKATCIIPEKGRVLKLAKAKEL